MLGSPKRTHDLRSSDQNVLFAPRIKTKKGEGSFSVAAPKLWNHLPGEIRTTKTVHSFSKKLSFSDLVLLCPGMISWCPE